MGLFSASLSMDLFATFLLLIAAVAAYFKWRYRYWSRRGVETPNPTIPIGNLGSLLSQKASMGEVLKNVYEEFKVKGLRYCGFYFFSQPRLIVFDLNLVRNILTKDFEYFSDHGNYVNEEADPLSGNLFSLRGLKWKNLRAKLTPTFTSGKMRMMFQTLVDCSDELVVVMDKLANEHQAINIKDVLGRFATDIIGSCAFGIDCNSLRNPDSEFRKYGRRVFEHDTVASVKNFLTIAFPELLEFLNVSMTKPDVVEFFTKIVSETVAYRERNNVTRKDFMHLLIQLKNNVDICDEEGVGHLYQAHEADDSTVSSEVGKTLTMPELIAQAFVFFAAGFETSSTTLTFCLYELVSNPEVQEKLREEILSTLTRHGGKITYDALADMTYMEWCINETLRKYPPVPMLFRRCTKTYMVPDSDLVLEKEVQVFVPILAIQSDPEYFPDPERFDPERFMPKNRAARHGFAWLPFGDGPRACIGLRFGVMQTKVALTVLLKNYKFGLSPKTKTPLAMDPKSFIMSPDGGMWLTAEKISM